MSGYIGILLDLWSAAQDAQAAAAQQAQVDKAVSEVHAQGRELANEIRKAQNQAADLAEDARKQVAEVHENARQEIASTTIQTERGMRNIYEELQKCKERAKTKDDEIKRLRLQVAAFGQRVQGFPAGAWN